MVILHRFYVLELSQFWSNYVVMEPTSKKIFFFFGKKGDDIKTKQKAKFQGTTLLQIDHGYQPQRKE